MLPGDHLLFGFVFSMCIGMLFPVIGVIGIFTILTASIFIDVDHYIASVKAGNGWKLSAALKWYDKKNTNKEEDIKKCFIPLHSIEFLLLFSLLLFININWIFNIILCMIIGFVFHIFLDWCVLLYHKEPMYYKVSFLYAYFKNKSLLRNYKCEHPQVRAKTKRFK